MKIVHIQSPTATNFALIMSTAAVHVKMMPSRGHLHQVVYLHVTCYSTFTNSYGQNRSKEIKCKYMNIKKEIKIIPLKPLLQKYQSKFAVVS